ncbi:hypothetical protein ACF1CG_12315 [Streptomyces sp. NPDC014773]|uniref:hypothetical protein n=1 Tax=Streptomyces sp. NPDC014773 TaxID=3364908 RepID=UPI0036F66D44
MDDEAEFERNSFRDGEPWDVVFDTLWIICSQFWLVLAAADRSVDVSTVIPAGDSIASNGDAVGIPTRISAGHVKVALSAWPATPPDGQGVPLGSSSIVVEGRELRLVNVEGREPGPVLVLEEDGPYEVRVWRSEVQGAEYFDIRVWQGPHSD